MTEEGFEIEATGHAVGTVFNIVAKVEGVTLNMAIDYKVGGFDRADAVLTAFPGLVGQVVDRLLEEIDRDRSSGEGESQ